jgi:hypothetical protein
MTDEEMRALLYDSDDSLNEHDGEIKAYIEGLLDRIEKLESAKANTNIRYMRDFRGTRALAIAKKIDKALHKKRLSTQGEEVTYTYDLSVQWMDDGSLAVEMCDEDSGETHTINIHLT